MPSTIHPRTAITTRGSRLRQLRLTRSASAALLVSVVALGAAGCGDDGSSSSGSSATASGTTSAAASESASASPSESASSSGGGVALADAKEGDTVDVDSFMQAMSDAQSKMTTYTSNFTMEMGSGAAGQNMKFTGQGEVDVTDKANPKMSMVMGASGQQMTMVVIGDAVYLKQGNAKYTKMTAAQMKQQTGQDFRDSLNPQSQLEKSRSAIDTVTFVGTEKIDGADARKYRVTMDLSKVAGASGVTAPSASGTAAASGAPTEMPYDFWLNEDDLPVKAYMKMAAQGINMTLTSISGDFGKPVNIKAPAASEITTS